MVRKKQIVARLAIRVLRNSATIKDDNKSGVNSYIVKPVDFANYLKVDSGVGLCWFTIQRPPK